MRRARARSRSARWRPPTRRAPPSGWPPTRAPAPRCYPSCLPVQPWFALGSGVEAVGDVAGERLMLRQSAKLLEIRLHPRILAKGIDIPGVSPLRIDDYLSPVPALEEVGRDPPRHLAEHGLDALMKEGEHIRLIVGLDREDVDEGGDGAIDANGGFHGGAPGLALRRQGGQGSANEAAGNEGPTRQPGLDRRHGRSSPGSRAPDWPDRPIGALQHQDEPERPNGPVR